MGNREIRMFRPYQITNAVLSVHTSWPQWFGPNLLPQESPIFLWSYLFCRLDVDFQVPFCGVWLSYPWRSSLNVLSTLRWASWFSVQCAHFLWQPQVLTAFRWLHLCGPRLARRILPSPFKAFTLFPGSNKNSCLLRVGKLQHIWFFSLETLGETASVWNTSLVFVFLLPLMLWNLPHRFPTLLLTAVLFTIQELVSPCDGWLR